jgi:hypothetical protein
MNQNQFLVDLMRGTCVTMTAGSARDMFKIKNLGARMSDLRSAGLRVRTTPVLSGKQGRPLVEYAVSARDVNGSRARLKM